MRKKNLQNNLTPEELYSLLELLTVAKLALDLEAQKIETLGIFRIACQNMIQQADHLIEVFTVEGT